LLAWCSKSGKENILGFNSGSAPFLFEFLSGSCYSSSYTTGGLRGRNFLNIIFYPKLGLLGLSTYSFLETKASISASLQGNLNSKSQYNVEP
jgi:hypothetical protein